MRSVSLPLLLFCAALLSLHSAAAFAESVPVQAGHSAYWYKPERSGAGLVLEVLSDEQVLLYWFTYDGAGQPRWLLGLGQVRHDGQGAFIEFPTLYAPRGGKFGQPFKLGPGDKPVVGQASLRFADCNQATFAYDAYDQSETIAVQRLTHTMGTASCWPYNGVPGKPVEAYAGQSGSWYDPTHSGAGFSLQWLYNGQALLTWYTFDTQGDPYWIMGLGHYEDGRIVFPEMYTTSGGRFGEAIDPDDLEYAPWGRLILTLDCASGTAHYDSILPAFGSGDLDLAHLTILQRPACPYVKPEFTDLYEVTWTEIPIEAGNPLEPVNIQAQSIADDGTVAATTYDGPALWRPSAEEWEFLHRDVIHPVFISPDGSSVYASEPVQTDPEGYSYPLLWREDTGWSQLSGLILRGSRITGISQDFSHVVGSGYDELYGGRTGWVWSEAEGQRRLPWTDEVRTAWPKTVSNNGNVVVGDALWFPDSSGFPTSPAPVPVAAVWKNGGDPQVLRDDTGIPLVIATACNRACNLIFGMGQVKQDPALPHDRNTWIWIEGDETVYVGAPDDALDTEHSMPTDVTADGDLVVGIYDSAVYPRIGFYIWTERSGIMSVDALVDKLGIANGHQWTMTNNPKVSPNGQYILLSGWLEDDQNRAVVLKLTPKDGVSGESD